MQRAGDPLQNPYSESIAAFTAAIPGYQAQLDIIMQGLLKFLARIAGNEVSPASIAQLVDPGRAMGLAATLLNALSAVLTNTFLILFTWCQLQQD